MLEWSFYIKHLVIVALCCRFGLIGMFGNFVKISIRFFVFFAAFLWGIYVCTSKWL